MYQNTLRSVLDFDNRTSDFRRGELLILSKSSTCKISDKVNRGKPRKKYVVFHVADDRPTQYIWSIEISKK